MTEPFDFAEHARRMPQSGIREIFSEAQKYDDFCDLSLGEPDFETPEPIVTAVTSALETGATGYTQTIGREDLRGALAEKLGNTNGIITIWTRS